MSRFRLSPTPAQETALLGHCAQARFVCNLALEQANSDGTAGRKAAPNFAAQCRQLTEARAEHQWLAAGSQTVQQQARRDLDQAWRNFYGWGVLVTRLEQKAFGRVEQINAAYTSQRCHACGYTAAESRESQARFVCRSCGHTAHADLNAARNIAAGHAGTARGGPAVAGPVNREPQHASLRVA